MQNYANYHKIWLEEKVIQQLSSYLHEREIVEGSVAGTVNAHARRTTQPAATGTDQLTGGTQAATARHALRTGFPTLDRTVTVCSCRWDGGCDGCVAAFQRKVVVVVGNACDAVVVVVCDLVDIVVADNVVVVIDAAVFCPGRGAVHQNVFVRGQ